MYILKIPHRKRDYFIPVMYLSAVILCAVCFASHGSGTSSLLSKGLSFVVTPLQTCTKGIYDFCSSASVYFGGMDALKEENEKLLKQNKKLSEENAAVKGLKAENDSLYKFLELKKEHTDYKFTNANVISRSSDGYTASFTVDKGSFHGIKENMPIISEEGALLGVTYSVDANSSRCKSIISYDMNIGIYDEETGETGILSGSFETFVKNKCLIQPLNESTTVKAGHRILTSGLGTVYPRGLIIGIVSDFIPVSGTHAMGAVVTPDKSSMTSDRVMVITSFERYYE